MHSKNKLIIISGASGAGKTTLVEAFLKSGHENEYEMVRTITTRKKRDANDSYIFVTEDEFIEMEKKGDLLEHTIYCGHRYGTPKEGINKILESGKTPIAVIDVKGRNNILANNMDLDIVSVFITTEPKLLYERLLERNKDSTEEIIERLSASTQEMLEGMKYDAVIMNNKDEIEKSAHLLELAVKGNYAPNLKEKEVVRYLEKTDALLKEISDTKSVSALMNRVEQFCQIRGWVGERNLAKDLGIGISTEAAELMELFRFQTNEAIETKLCEDDVYRTKVGEELADVLFFVFRFCSKYGYDPGTILVDKIKKNALNYPKERYHV